MTGALLVVVSNSVNQHTDPSARLTAQNATHALLVFRALACTTPIASHRGRLLWQVFIPRLYHAHRRSHTKAYFLVKVSIQSRSVRVARRRERLVV